MDTLPASTKLCCLVAAVTSALSFQANSQQLEEVIVTAQKRAESIQDVPISMQAMSGNDLKNAGVATTEDVMNLFPNVNVSTASDSNKNFFIRGVGTDDFHVNKVSAVGVYLDDVSINSPFGSSFSLFDMERVEVMRGPQNTLFGRNTTGGAVNFISRKPSVQESTNGYVNATIGRYNQQDLEGALGFSLGNTAAARVAFLTNNRDPVFENPETGDEYADRERHALRGQLAWDPSSNVSVLWNLHGGVSRGSGRGTKFIGLQDPTDPSQPCSVVAGVSDIESPPNCALADGFVAPGSDWEDVYAGEKPYENIDVWGSFVKLDWDLEPFTFSSITSLDKTEFARNEDSDAGPNILFHFYQEGDVEQWSQEFRFTSNSEDALRWISGLYYFFEDSDYATVVRRVNPPTAPSTPGSFTVLPHTLVQQDNTVLSAYGQGEYDLSHSLKLTAGLRWSEEEKAGTNNAGVSNGLSIPDEDYPLGFNVKDASPLFLLPQEKLQETWREWGGRLSLDYRASDDLLLYGSISRGFKGGGYSVAALQALNGMGSQPVEPEILLAYELGAKTNWFDNRVELNGAIFSYDWTELQSFQVLDGTPQLLNIPEASLTGLELELKAYPLEGLYVQAGMGYLDGQIEDSGRIGGGVRAGNELPQTPELTFNGLLRQEFMLKSGTLALQTNFRYTDDVIHTLNGDDRLRVDSHVMVNARISYAFGRAEQFEVALWGNNLLEERYCMGTADLRGLSEGLECAPNDGFAAYGLTFSAAFE